MSSVRLTVRSQAVRGRQDAEASVFWGNARVPYMFSRFLMANGHLTPPEHMEDLLRVLAKARSLRKDEFAIPSNDGLRHSFPISSRLTREDAAVILSGYLLSFRTQPAAFAIDRSLAASNTPTWTHDLTPPFLANYSCVRPSALVVRRPALIIVAPTPSAAFALAKGIRNAFANAKASAAPRLGATGMGESTLGGKASSKAIAGRSALDADDGISAWDTARGTGAWTDAAIGDVWVCGSRASGFNTADLASRPLGVAVGRSSASTPLSASSAGGGGATAVYPALGADIVVCVGEAGAVEAATAMRAAYSGHAPGQGLGGQFGAVEKMDARVPQSAGALGSTRKALQKGSLRMDAGGGVKRGRRATGGRRISGGGGAAKRMMDGSTSDASVPQAAVGAAVASESEASSPSSEEGGDEDIDSDDSAAEEEAEERMAAFYAERCAATPTSVVLVVHGDSGGVSPTAGGGAEDVVRVVAACEALFVPAATVVGVVEDEESPGWGSRREVNRGQSKGDDAVRAASLTGVVAGTNSSMADGSAVKVLFAPIRVGAPSTGGTRDASVCHLVNKAISSSASKMLRSALKLALPDDVVGEGAAATVRRLAAQLRSGGKAAAAVAPRVFVVVDGAATAAKVVAMLHEVGLNAVGGGAAATSSRTSAAQLLRRKALAAESPSEVPRRVDDEDGEDPSELSAEASAALFAVFLGRPKVGGSVQAFHARAAVDVVPVALPKAAPQTHGVKMNVALDDESRSALRQRRRTRRRKFDASTVKSLGGRLTTAGGGSDGSDADSAGAVSVSGSDDDSSVGPGAVIAGESGDASEPSEGTGASDGAIDEDADDVMAGSQSDEGTGSDVDANVGDFFDGVTATRSRRGVDLGRVSEGVGTAADTADVLKRRAARARAVGLVPRPLPGMTGALSMGADEVLRAAAVEGPGGVMSVTAAGRRAAARTTDAKDGGRCLFCDRAGGVCTCGWTVGVLCSYDIDLLAPTVAALRRRAARAVVDCGGSEEVAEAAAANVVGATVFYDTPFTAGCLTHAVAAGVGSVHVLCESSAQVGSYVLALSKGSGRSTVPQMARVALSKSSVEAWRGQLAVDDVSAAVSNYSAGVRAARRELAAAVKAQRSKDIKKAEQRTGQGGKQLTLNEEAFLDGHGPTTDLLKQMKNGGVIGERRKDQRERRVELRKVTRRKNMVMKRQKELSSSKETLAKSKGPRSARAIKNLKERRQRKNLERQQKNFKSFKRYKRKAGRKG